jgi:hypothetical protein
VRRHPARHRALHAAQSCAKQQRRARVHAEIERAHVRDQRQHFGGDDQPPWDGQYADDERVAPIDDQRVPHGDAHEAHRDGREAQIQRLVEQDVDAEPRRAAGTEGNEIPVELLVEGEEQARRGQCGNQPEERLPKIGCAGRRLVFEEPREEYADQDGSLVPPGYRHG